MAIIIFMLCLALSVTLLSGRLLRLVTGEDERKDQVLTLSFIGAFVGLGAVLNAIAPNYQLGLLVTGLGVGFSVTLLFSMTRGVWAMLLEPVILALLFGMGTVTGSGLGMDPIRLIELRLEHLGQPITASAAGYLSIGTAAGITAGVIVRSIWKLLVPALRTRSNAANTPAPRHAPKSRFGRSKSQKALDARVRRLT